MKILFITDSLIATDGWGRYSSMLVDGFQKKGDTVSVISSERNPHLSSAIEQYIDVSKPHGYLASPFLSWITARKVQKRIIECKPDVVHILVEPYAQILPFLHFDKTIKVFLTVHGTYSFIPVLLPKNSFTSGIAGILFKKALLKVQGIISVSSVTAAYFQDQYKKYYHDEYPSQRVTIVTNGIDTSLFSLGQKKKNPEQARKHILFVGAIKKRKGILEALEALQEYRLLYGTDCIYTIVGSIDEKNVYYRTLVEKIKEYHLEDVVVWAGRVSDETLRQLYSETDAYLMLPIQDAHAFEGFGFVYLEANAYGVPCVGSLGSGAVDAIKEGVTGYLVDASSKRDVAEALHKILDEESIQPEMCYEWAKKHESSKKIEEISVLYESNS